MAVNDKMSVVIIGAGAAGLMMALELHRRGIYSSIRILDKAPEVQQVGDAFALQPSALITIQEYPDLREEFATISTDAAFSIWKHTGGTADDAFAGRIFGPAEAEYNRPGAVHVARGLRVPWMVSRLGCIRMLVAAVKRRGIEVEWGRGATAYGSDEERAWVQINGDERLEADLVVAADGVGTMSHWAVKGRKIPATSSGFAIFRTVMPADVALASEVVRKNIGWEKGDRPEFRVYVGKEQMMNVVLSDEQIMYFLTHRDDGDAKEAWHQTVPAERVMAVANELPGWDPTILELVKQTPAESVVDWKLMWRDPHEKWTADSGRVVQIGDAAHSFLPTSGNGATQAIEDALSLAACLEKSGKQGVPQATKVFNLLRFERCATLQKLGVAHRQALHHLFDDRFGAISEEKLKEPEKILSFGKWMWGHNAIDYVNEKYTDALDHLTTGKEFRNTNLPPGYEFEPWTMAEVLEQERRGELSDLKSQGNWQST